jgi:hypothetical protein
VTALQFILGETVIIGAGGAAAFVLIHTVRGNVEKIGAALRANPAARDRAFVASRSSPQAVSTKGFNRFRGERP